MQEGKDQIREERREGGRREIRKEAKEGGWDGVWEGGRTGRRKIQQYEEASLTQDLDSFLEVIQVRS